MRISAPKLGARMGTVRNTMKVSDITRAMCRPEYRSRMTERVTTTLAAARPWTKRQARAERGVETPGEAAEQRPKPVESKPADQERHTAETIGHQSPKQLAAP